METDDVEIQKAEIAEGLREMVITGLDAIWVTTATGAYGMIDDLRILDGGTSDVIEVLDTMSDYDRSSFARGWGSGFGFQKRTNLLYTEMQQCTPDTLADFAWSRDTGSRENERRD